MATSAKIALVKIPAQPPARLAQAATDIRSVPEATPTSAPPSATGPPTRNGRRPHRSAPSPAKNEVTPQATTQEDWREDFADPFGPQSVGEAQVEHYRDQTGYTGG